MSTIRYLFKEDSKLNGNTKTCHKKCTAENINDLVFRMLFCILFVIWAAFIDSRVIENVSSSNISLKNSVTQRFCNSEILPFFFLAYSFMNQS